MAQDKLVRGTLHSSSMRKMGVGVAQTPHALVGQMIANSIDARARKITINIGKHGEFVECVDDGAGMPEEVWPHFIGMGDESKLGDMSTIGENGTGHTAYWMGFDHIEVWTAWAGDPNCHHLSFSYEDAWNFSQAGAKGGIQVRSVPKTSREAKIKGTGTIIRLSQPWKHADAIRVLPGAVARDIARVLSPWHLDVVTINGEHPKIDFPKGEFYRAVDELPGVGQIEIVAGFADRQVRDHDRSWGTWGAHVCSQSELLDQLPNGMEMAFPPELLHPQVWFMIRVPSWKGFEGRHTRRFFKPVLFQDRSFAAVVRHVKDMLVPHIRSLTQIQKGDATDANDIIERVVSRLAERIGQEEEEKRKKRKPTTALAFKPARVALLCTAEFIFEILNTDSEAEYEVDATASGGSIHIGGRWLTGEKARSRLKGPTQISYRAGAVEGRRFRMRITQLGVADGDPVPTAICEIRLDKTSVFSIVPIELTLEPGQTGRASVANDDGKTSLRWEFTDKGRITAASDGRSVEVTAPMEPGNYTITCIAHDGQRAEARLSVRLPAPPAGGEGTGILRKKLIVDGVAFVVMMLHQQEAGRSSQLTMSTGSGTTDMYMIWFNFEAPEAREAAKLQNGSLDQLLNHEVVMVIASTLMEREGSKRGMPPTVREVMQKRDDIMARVYPSA